MGGVSLRRERRPPVDTSANLNYFVAYFAVFVNWEIAIERGLWTDERFRFGTDGHGTAKKARIRTLHGRSIDGRRKTAERPTLSKPERIGHPECQARRLGATRPCWWATLSC